MSSYYKIKTGISTVFKHILLPVAIVFQAGCSNIQYMTTNEGSLTGKIIVQWIEMDEFIFLPDKDDPLTFVRDNGNNDIITPGKMHTDGGSIPKPLQAFRSFSPWGYAPAYMIHDWLFVMKLCEYDGFEKYDYKIAADILAEVIKTMMEQKEQFEQNTLAFYSIYKAVSSPVAKNLWENGECEPVAALEPGIKPKLEYTLDFN